MGRLERLALFDVDRTLINSSSGHAETFCFGLRKVYGVETTIEFVYANSMPADQQTIRRILEIKGLRETEVEEDLTRCIEEMGRYFNSIKNTLQVETLTGAAELLKRLADENYLLGLMTGNLEQIARGKLEKVELEHYFAFGGFGSDALTKDEIVKVALKKAKAEFSFSLEEGTAFLFGDSPHEIKAGKEAGVKTVGVATGRYSAEELRSVGAGYVLSDLRDTEEIVSYLESNVRP